MKVLNKQKHAILFHQYRVYPSCFLKKDYIILGVLLFIQEFL